MFLYSYKVLAIIFSFISRLYQLGPLQNLTEPPRWTSSGSFFLSVFTSSYQVVMSLFTSPFSSWFLSTPFTITNGTRQGCTLSPLIFALCIEPLAANRRASPDISGILIGNEVHKIELYPDDKVIILHLNL